ncbi:MAG: hypothetical protein KAI22_12075 [Gammaproteobacteria bacterium]|nr:hypothetical protein [Gammaproteobacteria bacterium]
MKNLFILLVLSLSLLTMSVQASETESKVIAQPSFNTGSDWWVEVTPEDPDYPIFKHVEANCFCN